MNVVVYDKHYLPDMLVFTSENKPVPTDDEVLVRIHASSVNALDYRSMQMNVGIPKSRIFGADIAGKVESVGKNVRTFKPGDRVFGDISACGSGGFAEYVSISQNVLVLIPDNVSFEHAAAIPVAGNTALIALRDVGNVQKNQKVLIYGSGGGVGNYAIQLAKYFGAEVTAVCGPNNVEIAFNHGANHVIDYTKENFLQSNKKYDLILAINGYHRLTDYKSALSKTGVYVMVGGTLSQIAKSIIFGPLMSLGRKKIRIANTKPHVKDLKILIDYVKEGKIIPLIDRRYPLNETAEAFNYMKNGHAKGKVIINIFEENKI